MAAPIVSNQIDYAHPIEGTYLITGERASRGYRLSCFCRVFMAPDERAAFQADPEGYMAKFGLPEHERTMVRARDWLGMQRYGVSFFLLLKLGGTMGIPQNEMGAAMKGMTYEEFLKTRKVRSASDDAGGSRVTDPAPDPRDARGVR